MKRLLEPQKLAYIWLIVLLLGLIITRLQGAWGLYDVDVDQVLMAPSRFHWFGTDGMGRDVLLRVFWGASNSLQIALQSLVILIVLSCIYGGLSGWFSRTVDGLMMMVLDVWLSLPSVILATLVGLLLHRRTDSLVAVSLILGLTHWGRLARLVRAEVMALKEKNFVKATEALGASWFDFFRDHISKSIYSVVSVYAVYQVPQLILAESFLSFIGLGVQAPETSLGLLLQDGWRSLHVYPNLVFGPALFLFLTVLAFNTIFTAKRGRPKANSPSPV